MSEQSARSRPAVPDVFDVHLTELLASLAKAGYADKTQHDDERLIRPFIRWVRQSEIPITDVDEACVDAFLARPSRVATSTAPPCGSSSSTFGSSEPCHRAPGSPRRPICSFAGTLTIYATSKVSVPSAIGQERSNLGRLKRGQSVAGCGCLCQHQTTRRPHPLLPR
jgi:hypothetical protein